MSPPSGPLGGAEPDWIVCSEITVHTTVFMRERKQSEQAAQEYEQRYKRLVSAVTDYVYSVTIAQGRPVETAHGPGCEAVTGYTSKEFEADPYLWYRMIYNEDRAAVMAQAERVLHGETASPLEHRINHKDGRLRWIRNTPVPHKDDQGGLLGYDGMVSDITERKRAEQFLAVQYTVTRNLGEASSLDEALARILESICGNFRCFLWDLAAFWRVDAEAHVLRCIQTWHALSAHVEEFEAVSREVALAPGVSLPGQVWASGEPAWIADGQKVETNCPRAPYARKAGFHGTCAFPIGEGKQCVGVIELFSRNIQPPDAEMTRVLVTVGTQVCQFIQRKTAEEQNRLGEARLQAIMDNSPTVIHLKDLQGRYVLVNRRFEQLFHQRREEIVGKTPFELFPREAAQVLRNNDQQVMSPLAPMEFEEVLPVDGGCVPSFRSSSRYWMLRVSPMASAAFPPTSPNASEPNSPCAKARNAWPS